MQHDLSGLPDPNLDAQFYTGVPLKRFLAWVIDAIIVTAFMFVVVIGTLGIAAFFFYVVWLLISFSYRAYMLNKHSATLGMKALGIELRNGHGYKLNKSESFWHVGLYLALMTFFLFNLVSIVMILASARKQGLHDMLLGTTAINTPDD